MREKVDDNTKDAKRKENLKTSIMIKIKYKTINKLLEVNSNISVSTIGINSLIVQLKEIRRS